MGRVRADYDVGAADSRIRELTQMGKPLLHEIDFIAADEG